MIATIFEVVFLLPLVVGGAVAVGIVMFEYATASVWVFRGTTAPIEHLRIEPRVAVEGARRIPEPAYRGYYFGPVFHDYGLAVRKGATAGWARALSGRPGDPEGGVQPMRSVAQTLTDRWSHIGRYLPGDQSVIKAVTFLPLLGVLIGLVSGAVAATGIGLVISVLFGLAIVLAVTAAVVLAGLMRLLELGMLRARGITLECPACHRKAVSPAYLCPHCPAGSGPRALHRRLIPGTHGVFSRVCRCGSSLPTLLARGKYLLEGFCQHCDAALPVKSMTAPTLHIPVVAGRQAGKTVFMTAAVAGLEQQLRDGRGADGFEFADPASLDEYVRARDALSHDSYAAIRATTPVVAAPAFNIYLGTGRARRLMYLYDAAGERFEQEAGVATLRYLEHSGGVVVIVDPFSFPAVRRSVEPQLLDGVRHSIADVGDVVGRFAEGLRQSVGGRAVQKLDVKVAVVLTKCDALLRSNAVAHPYDQLGQAALDPRKRADRSAAVRAWLTDSASQGGLVHTLENTFGQGSFFAVSAADAFNNSEQRSGRTQLAVRNDDPAAPLQWLLERRSS